MNNYTHQSQTKTVLNYNWVLVVALTIWLLPSAYSLNPDSLKMDARPEIKLLTEYDDNYDLLNASDANFDGDGLIHLMPRFGFSRNHKTHFYGIAFDSDLRKGMYSAPFKSNLATAGKIDLNYNNGLQISLNDYFQHTDFDLGLTDLPEISKRQMNNFTSKITYNITKKFKIYGAYDNRYYSYNRRNFNDRYYKRMSNVFGGGMAYNFSKRVKLNIDYTKTQEKYTQHNDSIRNRSLDNVDANLLMPLTRSLSTYINYTFNLQSSEEIAYRDYADNRAVGGIIWQGRNRLKVWVEAGYQTIIFKSPLLTNYYQTVGLVGMDLKLTQVLSAYLTAGIDGYSNFVFNGKLSYHYSNRTSVNLVAARNSQANFYSTSLNPYYTAYNYQLNFLTKIKESVLVKLGGSFQTRDDFSSSFDLPTSGNISQTSKLFVVLDIKPVEKLDIVLDGSYLMLKSSAESVNYYQYDTWLGKVSINYSLKKWANMGAQYQYASRIAENDTYSYNNNRFGLYVKFIF